MAPSSFLTIPKIELTLQQLWLIAYPILILPAIILLLAERRHQQTLKTLPKGCKRIGMRGYSNIKDEYDDRKYATGVAAGQTPTGEANWKVKALFIYPIKSCAPVELNVADIDGSGLLWDRKFSFAELLKPQVPANAPESAKQPVWTFRTLRTPGFERFALVKPEVWVPDPKAVQDMTQKGADKEGALIIRYPYVVYGPLAPLKRVLMKMRLLPSERSFRVPLIPPPNHDYPSEDVVIWKDKPRWLNYGRHVPDEFKAFIGAKHDLSLFRVDPESYRQVFRCAPRKEQVGYQPTVGFADGYPMHLLNLTSVRDLANRISDDIPRFSVRRFRPNVLVTGPPAYDEDDWKRVRLGDYEFYCACHTVRCRLPNVDPDSSFRHPVEPDKMLKSYRCIDDGDRNNACMGLQLVPAKNVGVRLRPGDEVEVLERGEHHYIPQGG